MAFKHGMAVDLCMAYNYYAHAHFDDLDLDLDARSQHLGRGNKSTLNYLDNYKASNTDAELNYVPRGGTLALKT